MADRVAGVDFRHTRFHYCNSDGHEDRGITGVLVAGDQRCRENTHPGSIAIGYPWYSGTIRAALMASIGVPFSRDNREVPVRGDTIGSPVQEGFNEQRGIVQFGDGEEKGHVIDRGVIGKIDGIEIIVALALAGGLVELPG